MRHAIDCYHKAQAWARAHHRAIKHTHWGSHMAYLGLVSFHGPYTYAAGWLLLLAVVMFVLHIESE